MPKKRFRGCDCDGRAERVDGNRTRTYSHGGRHGRCHREDARKAMSELLTAIEGEMERESKVLDAMLPPVEALTDAATTQLRWNALARGLRLRARPVAQR